MARHVDTANTTVMTRLIQAALLTLLLQLIAQMYPSRLSRTFSNQQRSNSDTVLTWELPAVAIANAQWVRRSAAPTR